MSDVNTADENPSVYIVSPARTCDRDQCENKVTKSENYCSRNCWAADNPEVAL